MSIDTLPDPGIYRRTRDQRSQRAVAGWLATRMRAGARARRRGAHDDPAPDPPTLRTHDSLGAFVAEDERRELRNEHELGDFWLADGFPPAAWRAAWLPRTGELYMQRIGGVPPSGRVTVVAHFADEAALTTSLTGWENIAGTPGSVHWLLERLGLDDSHLPATATAGDA
ncbi:MAG: hypothetical protein QOJ89_4118 [bacterium]|jgi:hypothetical protein